jgi:MoaA/NifB/PqqE/SkfB family radical SAM enzyme
MTASAAVRPLSAAHRKARLLAAYLRRQPVWCTWQVTPRCGALCHLCDHRTEGALDELDLEGCRTVADALGAMGSLVVSLSGGEPFLRSDLPEIVALLATRHFPLLTTHGWLVTRERAEAVWQAGLEAASVVIDDADAGRHDERFGVKGAHARAVAALALLAETRTRPGQQVNVKARLRPGATDGLEALLQLASAHGATVTVEPGYPVGQGAAWTGTPALRALKRRHANLRSSTFFLERLDAAFAGGVAGCQAARAFFNVDQRGRVSKCLEFRAPEDRVGDLARDAPQAVLERLHAVHASNECRSCWYSARGEVEASYTVRGFVAGLAGLVRS